MEYKVGMKIRITNLDDPFANYEGRFGEIQHIDDIGQLHGTWGGLALIPNVDDFRVLTEDEYQTLMQLAHESSGAKFVFPSKM